MTNDNIIERAQALAARNGGDWADFLIAARREPHLASLQKLVKRSSAAEVALRKRADETRLRHQMPGGVGSVDVDRRQEIGEIETSLGRVRLSVSRDSFSINSINTLLTDVDKDLRLALVASAAAFDEAETDEEQTDQRAIIAIVIDAVMRRHQFLTARVKETKRRERFDV